ncbi:NUDIX hydrolase [Bacillus cereus]|uniref:NUDIX hydrolase n=1 Tax=Bacillus cereus TaxID=1396 RepID=UPI0035CA7C74
MDIKVNVDGVILNCRSAGFILKNNKILLHKEKKVDFWAPIGGKVKIMESSVDAVKREYKEELDIEVEVERLIWMAENFFEFEGKKYHEYTFVYLLIDVNDVLSCEDEEISVLNEKQFVYKWIDLDEINKLSVKPGFLSGNLEKLPKQLVHVIYKD